MTAGRLKDEGSGMKRSKPGSPGLMRVLVRPGGASAPIYNKQVRHVFMEIDARII
jgi:hypothetical protein